MRLVVFIALGPWDEHQNVAKLIKVISFAENDAVVVEITDESLYVDEMLFMVVTAW